MVLCTINFTIESSPFTTFDLHLVFYAFWSPCLLASHPRSHSKNLARRVRIHSREEKNFREEGKR